MILFEARASIILYNILTSLEKPKKFILPLNVCPIVPATFLKAKVEFEFIDISLETLCIDEKLLLNKVHDKNIGGVLYVKTYGIELDTTQLFKDIKNINQNIFIIDDCCLQIPKFDYTLKESYADLALFSTGYSKYIDIGWGGFGFLNDDFSYKKNNLTFKEKDLEAFTHATQNCIDNNCLLDYQDNFWLGASELKFDNFQLYKNEILKKIEQMHQHKKNLNYIYDTNLPKEIQLGNQFSNWRFSILVKNKETLLKEIFQAGLFASSHYKEIDYMYKDDTIKNSNVQKIHEQIINLFNDFRFDEEMAYKVVAIINKNLIEGSDKHFKFSTFNTPCLIK